MIWTVLSDLCIFLGALFLGWQLCALHFETKQEREGSNRG